MFTFSPILKSKQQPLLFILKLVGEIGLLEYALLPGKSWLKLNILLATVFIEFDYRFLLKRCWVFNSWETIAFVPPIVFTTIGIFNLNCWDDNGSGVFLKIKITIHLIIHFQSLGMKAGRNISNPKLYSYCNTFPPIFHYNWLSPAPGPCNFRSLPLTM